MSTRSFIGVMNEGGSVTFIYCHSDGYPEPPGVGAKLMEHWTDPARVSQLMELGDLSWLGETLDPPAHAVDVSRTFAYHRDYDRESSWRNRGGSVNFATGEDFPPRPPEPQRATDKVEFAAIADEAWTQYAYLLTPTGWEFHDANTHAPRRAQTALWRPLEEVLKEVLACRS